MIFNKIFNGVSSELEWFADGDVMD